MDSEQHIENQRVLHMGHFGAIFLCAAVLVFTSWMKSGFHFDFSSSAHANNSRVVTYEQAHNEVLAQNGDPAANAATLAESGRASENLAMLDPSASGGAVLGASTAVSEEFPDVDQIVTAQMLDQIKVSTVATSSVFAIQTYSDRLAYVESEFNTLGMVMDINSQDPAQLRHVNENAKNLVAVMAQIPVPQELVTYHKMKMMYYMTLGFIGQNLGGENSDLDINSLTNIMFSLSEKLDRLGGEISSKYNVQL